MGTYIISGRPRVVPELTCNCFCGTLFGNQYVWCGKYLENRWQFWTLALLTHLTLFKTGLNVLFFNLNSKRFQNEFTFFPFFFLCFFLLLLLSLSSLSPSQHPRPPNLNAHVRRQQSVVWFFTYFFPAFLALFLHHHLDSQRSWPHGDQNAWHLSKYSIALVKMRYLSKCSPCRNMALQNVMREDYTLIAVVLLLTITETYVNNFETWSWWV